MSEQIDAVFINGVFHPEQPVKMADGQRVSLTVAPKSAGTEDLNDVRDLLDTEFMEACRGRAGLAPSLETIRARLASFSGSPADRIFEEREER